jgi:hypothetical protein
MLLVSAGNCHLAIIALNSFKGNDEIPQGSQMDNVLVSGASKLMRLTIAFGQRGFTRNKPARRTFLVSRCARHRLFTRERDTLAGDATGAGALARSSVQCMRRGAGKSRLRNGRPPSNRELQNLIRQMSHESPASGAPADTRLVGPATNPIQDTSGNLRLCPGI